jgi:hypothetical protein
MNSQRNRIAVFVCLFLAVSVTMAQDEDRRSKVFLQVDTLHLYDGLPGGVWGSAMVRVGGRLDKNTTTEKDESGNVVYLRTLTGQTRWLPDNAIEVTLAISENGAERTETVRLENFEPKTIVLRKDAAMNSVELLRFIPVFKPNGFSPQAGGYIAHFCTPFERGGK